MPVREEKIGGDLQREGKPIHGGQLGIRDERLAVAGVALQVRDLIAVHATQIGDIFLGQPALGADESQAMTERVAIGSPFQGSSLVGGHVLQLVGYTTYCQHNMVCVCGVR